MPPVGCLGPIWQLAILAEVDGFGFGYGWLHSQEQFAFVRAADGLDAGESGGVFFLFVWSDFCCYNALKISGKNKRHTPQLLSN